MRLNFYNIFGILADRRRNIIRSYRETKQNFIIFNFIYVQNMIQIIFNVMNANRLWP